MSANFVDLTGQIFGKRVVLNRETTPLYRGKKGSSKWKVKCECGAVRIVSTSNLKRSTSCGCDKEYAVRSGDKRRGQRDNTLPKNEYHLKRTFGLSIDQFNDMVLRQGGCCAICHNPFTKTPHVDHDHACCKGKVSCGKCIRGLLCHGCNTALGNLKDSVILLKSSIQYLEGYEANTINQTTPTTSKEHRWHCQLL